MQSSLNQSVDVVDVIVKSLPAATGFLGAWFGTKWGVTKFKKEKYWESKVTAYTKVISSVEAIAFWGECVNAERFSLPTVGEIINDPVERFHTSMRVITELEVIGEIYFSHDFHSLVKKFKNAVNKEYYAYHEESTGLYPHEKIDNFGYTAANIRDISRASLKEMTVQAKNDIVVV